MRNWSLAMLPLALAACDMQREQDTSGATAEPVAREAPTQPPEAAVPTLTAEGWGPLRIGMTLDEVTAALGPDLNPDAVGGAEPETCDEFRPERAPDGIFVMIQDGILTRISVTDPATIQTDTGLKIGSTEEEVRATYGSRLHAEPHHYLELPAEYLTIWTAGDPGDRSYTEDPTARGIRYETGLARTVETIHAGDDSIQLIEGCL